MRPPGAGHGTSRSLIPREHGAYAQLILPQIAVLSAGRPTLAAVLMCLGSALAFVSHESLMVASGGRGKRALREDGARARRTLATYGALGAVMGLLGAWLLAAESRFTLVAPIALAGAALLTSARLGPRSLASQLASSAAFACAVLPVGAAAGLPLRSSLVHAAVWLLVFLVSTSMARALAHRAERSRRLLLAAAAAGLLGLAWAFIGTWVPMAAAVALTPACLACVAVSLHPPSPSKLRAVGWTLVATSTFAGTVLALGVSLSPS